jgi:NAD(P)H dehydrogenase (quinone)
MKIAIIYHSETGNTRRMAEIITEGAAAASEQIEARSFDCRDWDADFVAASKAVILGCPTYQGTLSWPLKRWLDEGGVDLAGKLGGCFASQNWPGGGGADLAEITIIAGMLVRGMLVYSGGIKVGQPFLHFGAVSTRAPEGLYVERCRKLGENIALKALELFGGKKD